MPMSHRNCPICGNQMNRQSVRCRNCYLGDATRPQSYMRRGCRKCGKEFRSHKAQTARQQGIYCSVTCARSGSPTRKRTRAVCTCKVCGASFEKHVSEMRKNTGAEHFCSSRCWYEHNQGERHVLWTGGQNERINPVAAKWRKAVLRRDKRHCRICHNTTRLEVHHILPFGTHGEQRWAMTNGLTLCHGCHVKFRHRELDHSEMLTFIASIPVEVWSA
jgi:5-methylcytosine-specific restriction endonuclease McrA